MLRPPSGTVIYSRPHARIEWQLRRSLNTGGWNQPHIYSDIINAQCISRHIYIETSAGTFCFFKFYKLEASWSSRILLPASFARDIQGVYTVQLQGVYTVQLRNLATFRPKYIIISGERRGSWWDNMRQFTVWAHKLAPRMMFSEPILYLTKSISQSSPTF